MNISRRTLAKALAASGTVAGVSRLLGAESSAVGSPVTATWTELYPGVWRATIGKPEKFTPVSSRLVPTQLEALAKLPRVHRAPLPPIVGRRTDRGCTVQFPLRPHEQIFGFGLQLLSFAQRGKRR